MALQASLRSHQNPSYPTRGSPSAIHPIDEHHQGHHLIAYDSALLAQAGYQAVNAIRDPVIPDNGVEFQIFDEYQIAAAYAGAAANVRTRLVTASLQLRGNAHVQPISGTKAPGVVRPQVMNLTADPIHLRIGENLHCDMESNSATNALVGLWMVRREHDFSVEFRDLRWIRFTASITTVAETGWSLGPVITLDDPLEGGDYAVYGMQVFATNGLLARLVFPQQVFRPGCLCQATAVSMNDPLFWGGLGLWGVFNFLAPPRLEVLSTTAETATYTGWLLASNTLGIGADLA